MKNKSQKYPLPRKVQLPCKLITLLRETYPEKNLSASLIKALEDFLRLELPKTKSEDFGLYQILAEADFDSLDKKSVRLPQSLVPYLYHCIERSKVADNLSHMITLIIGQVLYFRKDKSAKNITEEKTDMSEELADIALNSYKNGSKFWERTKPLLHVHGNKFDEKMQAMIRWILENADAKPWQTSVETCAGGLGIHLNFDFAPKAILNDDDWAKMNLYRVIKTSPEELIQHAQSYEVNKSSFNTIKNRWQQRKEESKTAETDIEAAAQFLYLNLVSFFNDSTTYNVKNNEITQEKYEDCLQIIHFAHRKLKDTELLETDIFDVIEKYMYKKDVLFIIDPPYLSSKGYKRIVRNEKGYGSNFDWDEHKKLAKMIQQLSEKGNDFIYFCRVTYREKGLLPEELEAQNRYMAGKIGFLYRNRGFYYVDVKIDKNITERIITSFHFKGATVYGKEGK